MKPIALALAAAALFAIQPLRAAAAPPAEIQVTGTGSSSMVPDQATVDAAIVTDASGSSEAVSANNAVYDRAVRALTAAGVARSDIALGSYDVQYVPRPRQAAPNDGTQYGFTVTRGFRVTTRNIGRAGNLVDTLVHAGVTTINGVAFGIADETGARARALEAAMADARSKAEALAHGARLHVTGIKSIVYGDGGRMPGPMPMAAMRTMPTQFDPGNEQVSTSVTVTFFAEP